MYAGAKDYNSLKLIRTVKVNYNNNNNNFLIITILIIITTKIIIILFLSLTSFNLYLSLFHSLFKKQSFLTFL